MNNEIKEILEDYKKLGGEITEKLDNTAEYETWLIIQDYFDKLLDYITNLQEYYNHNVNNYEDLIVKYSNLRERNEKAIKYIENNLTEDDNGCGCWWYSLGYYETPDELLSILKGEDK